MRIIRSNSGMLKVKVVVFNQGTSSEYYNLMTVPDNKMLYAASGKQWKTKAGASKWAKAQGFDVVESSMDIFSDTDTDSETDPMDYFNKLARGSAKEIRDWDNGLSVVDYNVTKDAITFIIDDVPIYIQPTEDIIPRENDLDKDISELSDAVIDTIINQMS